MRPLNAMTLLSGLCWLGCMAAQSVSAQPSAVTNPKKKISPLATPSSRPQKLTVTLPSSHMGRWGVFGREAGQASGFGPISAFATARWAEDWSNLRTQKGTDPFDVLKYVPLDKNGEVYLSLSGEERLYNWFENRPGLGLSRIHDSGRMTLRSIYGADLHFGRHLRFYGEVVNGAAGGWNPYGYNQGYTTRLDLLQGFGEFDTTILGAKSGLMLGRMEFLDAPNYVLYQRTVSNIPESWNGGRWFAIWPRFRIDLFDFVQTNINPPTMFHDVADWKTRLYGAYTSYALPDFRFAGRNAYAFIDLFYYGYRFYGGMSAVATPSGIKNGWTQRSNIGTRFWGQAGPLEFSLGAIYQSGRFHPYTGADMPVRAYAINTTASWHFAHATGKPFAGVQADVYSGGENGRTIGTYVLPFVPTHNYLDTTSYIGGSNVIGAGPIFGLNPYQRVQVQLKVPAFWRAARNDAVYSATGAYTLPAFKGRFLGVIPQLAVTMSLDRHMTWRQDLGRLFVSSSLQNAGGSDATYYLSTLDFRF